MPRDQTGPGAPGGPKKHRGVVSIAAASLVVEAATGWNPALRGRQLSGRGAATSTPRIPIERPGAVMRVMVIVKATNESESGAMPKPELLAAMGKFNEELVKAGVMLDGAGLKPSRHGARVRFSGTNRSVIDGPFTETKELVAGYWLWQVKSLDEAIEWLKRCPHPHPGETADVEIRPLFEESDFAAK
jgi:hypothetical protein